jgi:aspartyl protease family protein
MGLQDRDYYRERYRNSSLSNAHGKSSGLKYLWLPALTLGALWYGSDAILERIKTGKPINPVEIIAERKSSDLITGGIVLKADRQGHFRGTVLVNNVPMPFLIDTGATTTTIPKNMAIRAGLPFGRQVHSNTAGGQVTHHLTQINSFKIGNVTMRYLDAQINPYLDEVLIGMNTLKYFRMTQNGNTLTLEANNPQISQARNAWSADLDEPQVQRPAPKPVTVKKKVICDERQVCKTIYSDH